MKLQKTQPPRKPIIFLSSTYCINQCNCWEQNTFFFFFFLCAYCAAMPEHVTCFERKTMVKHHVRFHQNRCVREFLTPIHTAAAPEKPINSHPQQQHAQQHYSLHLFVTYFTCPPHNFTLAPYLLSNIIVSNLSRRRDNITLVTRHLILTVTVTLLIFSVEVIVNQKSPRKTKKNYTHTKLWRL